MVDAWSYHMIRHLLSMHGHVICYITHHCFILMSYDTSPTVMSCDTSPTIDFIWFVTCHRCMVMSYDTSPTGHVIWYIAYHVIWYTTYHRCHMIHHLRLCHMIHHMIHHLSSMHDHVLGYITYHRYIVLSNYISPTIHACLLAISHITYHRCMTMSWDESPIIDVWSCLLVYHL